MINLNAQNILLTLKFLLNVQFWGINLDLVITKHARTIYFLFRVFDFKKSDSFSDGKYDVKKKTFQI